MENISNSEYRLMSKGAGILSKDNKGDKVLHLRDGSLLKLFRIRHIISTARFYPYSLRFVNNAKKLRALNIPTVETIKYFKIPSINRTAVQYRKLEGETLPTYLSHKKLTEELAEKFGSFIATLHNKGVYFRSIHLENVIVLPDESFGLIDVSDMKMFSHSLSLRMRNGNFRHLTRYETHRDLLKTALMPFIQAYMRQSNISKRQRLKLRQRLLKHFI